MAPFGDAGYRKGVARQCIPGDVHASKRTQNLMKAHIRFMLFAFLNVVARYALCPLGQHSKSTGIGFDSCSRGCGFVRNPGALKRYEVLLKSGERFESKGINEFHAASMIIYGGNPLIMDIHGKALGDVKVLRENIHSVRLLLPNEICEN